MSAGCNTPNFNDHMDPFTRYQNHMLNLPPKTVDIITEDISVDPITKDVSVPVMVTYRAKDYTEHMQKAIDQF